MSQTELDIWFSPSVKQHWNLIVHWPIRLKGNSKCISSNLLSSLGAENKDMGTVLQLLLNALISSHLVAIDHFALTAHVTLFLWKWKLYDFAFKKWLVGHILNKIKVIWNLHHCHKMSKFVAGHVTKMWFWKLRITSFWIQILQYDKINRTLNNVIKINKYFGLQNQAK